MDGAALYKDFRCQKAWVDATGVGDVVVEELEKADVTVEPFVFSAPSRKSLSQGHLAAQISIQNAAPASNNPTNVGVNSMTSPFVLDFCCAPFFVDKRRKDPQGSKWHNQIELVGLTLACCVPHQLEMESVLPLR